MEEEVPGRQRLGVTQAPHPVLSAEVGVAAGEGEDEGVNTTKRREEGEGGAAARDGRPTRSGRERRQMPRQQKENALAIADVHKRGGEGDDVCAGEEVQAGDEARDREKQGGKREPAAAAAPSIHRMKRQRRPPLIEMSVV